MEQLTLLLEQQQHLSTKEVMEALEVSESTARRLVTRLCQSGEGTRVFGGVQAPQSYRYELLEKENPAAKLAIARQAMELVRDGDVIYIDGGTTCACFASLLAEACGRGEYEELSVFTNSFATLSLLSPVCRIHCVGGRYRKNRRDFCGAIAESTVSGLRFTRCFLGTDACEADRGFTTTDFDTARLASLVISVSGESFVLCGGEKFFRRALVPYAGLGQVTGVLSGGALEPQTMALFRQAGAAFLPPASK